MPERRPDASEAIGAAIGAATARVAAPAGLRVRIAREREVVAGRRRDRTLLLAAVTAGLAALVIALVVVVAPGTPTPPSVAEAAGVALAAPTAPPPPVNPADPRFVRASLGGIRFPNYAYDTAWTTAGGRADTLRRRGSRTVTYSRGSARVGYTIVNGPPLATPTGARWVSAGGTSAWVARIDGALVVAWDRAGHTCVLASRTASLPQMLRFVAWRGEA